MKKLLCAFLFSIYSFTAQAQTTINVFSPTDKVDSVKINANFQNLQRGVDSTWSSTTNPLTRNFNIFSNSLTGVSNLVGSGGGIITNFTEAYIGTVIVSKITQGTGTVDAASISNWNNAYYWFLTAESMTNYFRNWANITNTSSLTNYLRNFANATNLSSQSVSGFGAPNAGFNMGGQSITNIGNSIIWSGNSMSFYSLNGGLGGLSINSGAGTFTASCMGKSVFGWTYADGFQLYTNLNMSGCDVTNLNGYASLTGTLNQTALNIGNASNNAVQGIANTLYNSNSIAQHQLEINLTSNIVVNLPTNNWNTVYGWGDHATNGYLKTAYSNHVDLTYLKTYSETDPIFVAQANAMTNYLRNFVNATNVPSFVKADGTVAMTQTLNMGNRSIDHVGANITADQTYLNIYTTNGGLNAITISSGGFSVQVNGNVMMDKTYTDAWKFYANVNPSVSNSYTLGDISLPWSDLIYGNSLSLTGTLNQTALNITYNSNNMHNASALTNQLYAVSMNYAVATNGASFSNSIAWTYAPKAGVITNVIAESTIGNCKGALWVRSNGVANTANSYIAYTNIPAVAGTSSNIFMTVPYNAGVFIGVPVTNGSASNVTFTIIGVE